VCGGDATQASGRDFADARNKLGGSPASRLYSWRRLGIEPGHPVCRHEVRPVPSPSFVLQTHNEFFSTSRVRRLAEDVRGTLGK
jgi:hypothetical protein